MTMEREEAIAIIDNLHLIGCGRNQHECDIKTNEALDMAIKALSEKKTDRPIGEWINKGDYAECSICGAHSASQFDGVELIPLKTKFCHNCGVEMKIPLYAYASWDRSEE